MIAGLVSGGYKSARHLLDLLSLDYITQSVVVLEFDHIEFTLQHFAHMIASNNNQTL
jgi:hypothetical protein